MKPTTILTTIASDSHSWGLVYLQLLLEENGHEVINLGTCVPVDVLIERCHQVKPQTVVVSSVNGHGHLDGVNIIKAIKNYPLLKNIRVVIGGKLGTEGHDNTLYADKLMKEGYDAVFSEHDIFKFISFMNRSENTPKRLAI